jgi:hypothetical protein
MTHLEYLKKRLESKRFSESDYAILNSLILSLSSNEACMFFDMKFEQDYRVRHYVLRKISNDIKKSYTNEHRKLISLLLKKLNEKGFDKKESCSFSIDFLYDSLSTKHKNLILNKFLESKSLSNRNRAYKRLFSNWNNKYQEIMVKVWASNNDTNCLGIIINHFPLDYLLANYKDLIQHAKPFQITKLFLKLGTVNYDLVHDLKSIDQISYSYVLVKFDKKLTNTQASEFLKNNYKDNRIGLLLWCFGKMGLWDNIIEFETKYKDKHDLAMLDHFVHD